MKGKRFIATGMAMSCIVMSATPVLAERGNEGGQAVSDTLNTPEYSDEYKQYLEDLENDDTEKYGARVPAPYKVKGTEVGDQGTGIDGKVKNKADSIPEKYDPRVMGLTTPAKDQRNLGTCWSFAAMGSLEHFLKLKGYQTYDFSEEHLIWWANGGAYSWNISDITGASNFTSMGYFSSWMGPKSESDIPYNGMVSISQGAKKPANFNTAKSQINVNEMMYVASNRDSVKNAIKQYGSIVSGYAYFSQFESLDKNSYNCDKSMVSNHAISVVGWDDNYSKDKFREGHKPANNGAWLVKNSWGQYNAESGYFWVSYEDRTLLKDSDNYSFRTVEEPDSSKKIYQLEYGGVTPAIQKGSLTAANVFDFSSYREKIDSVTFATESIGALYNIYYAPVSGNVPQNDKKVKIGSGNISFAGYTNAKVGGYNMPKGKGAIIVELIGSGEQQIDLEAETPIQGYSDFIASANQGESYILNNGKFEDVNSPTTAPSNFIIKAVTKADESYTNISHESLVGENRYETSVKISKNGWNSADNAILVNGDAIPDALAATPLSTSLDAPILLTEKGTLNKKTEEELKRLGVKNVYIMGGNNSVSEDIENKLKASSYKVDRTSGNTRYDTSMEIAKKLNKIKKVDKIAVVNGVKGLPDAISVGAPAGMNNMPIVLLDPSENVAKLNDFIKDTNVDKSYIIGGQAVLSDSLAGKLKSPTRLYGSNRNATNAKIIDEFYKDNHYDNAYIVKDGSKKQGDLIDGLSVGPLASKTKSPVALVKNELEQSQKDVLGKMTFSKIIQVGGGANQNAFEELLYLKRTN
ncbi:MAG: cell wall-binding repeat-containing protein [Clostridioides sp.]|jgi:C1A family cysteine protease/putative cell wall-binding protein|nr:cell wall-binding repeat-containing protein [Clostridioides sp.]